MINLICRFWPSLFSIYVASLKFAYYAILWPFFISGYITLEEFSDACNLLRKHMPNPITQEQLVDICRLMDINKDGLVDLNEFLETFRLVDTDKQRCMPVSEDMWHHASRREVAAVDNTDEPTVEWIALDESKKTVTISSEEDKIISPGDKAKSGVTELKNGKESATTKAGVNNGKETIVATVMSPAGMRNGTKDEDMINIIEINVNHNN